MRSVPQWGGTPKDFTITLSIYYYSPCQFSGKQEGTHTQPRVSCWLANCPEAEPTHPQCLNHIAFKGEFWEMSNMA